MGMRKCKWCHGWYNQQETEVYCWSCREQGNDKKLMELKRLKELEARK
ncbi:MULTISPECIES: hypothetical protein [Bacillus cereus group]|nr:MULTISPECIES: hypothetical protein [Bacillus cereus group]MDX5884943.1 hypothetical protein [Bacillus cereus group sp. BfR-BA-00999]MDX6046745.1 hypothetical protein [Bacillus paranthracis]